MTSVRTARTERGLRRWVLEEIAQTGFQSADGLIVSNGALTKDEIRGLHARQRAELLVREHRFVSEWQDELIQEFADGSEINPADISPRVVQVRTEAQAALFRFASLHWSVPVSRGYGRRTRFLVTDEQNGKLIGIFALGDPVYNLTARDQLVGWDHEQRSERLYNVLDAFVLGSVPPYRQLLGAKLVAMAAVSDTTREMIKRKYHGQKTEIRGEFKQARPVLITTTSALGRSSLYNRLKYQGRLLYEPVGYTKGFGHFQFSEPLFRALVEYLSNDGGVPGNAYGDGPNWRIRTLRVALSKIDLNPDLIQHGVKRQVFIAPLARRWKEFLRGEVTYPFWYRFELAQMAEHFRTRWAVPRSTRDSSYAEVRGCDMALTSKQTASRKVRERKV